eukprot:7219497-Alexandrium_andersonii.AAC.1
MGDSGSAQSLGRQGATAGDRGGSDQPSAAAAQRQADRAESSARHGHRSQQITGRGNGTPAHPNCCSG